ncbi:uncharacterized protein LOC116294684 [Actinia tenebrosa]|uniref:Uncharacterized protein LOC116294684 n=1 Tax=Actinia tenebrosa TaxID=6105 RepID=A0A6P8HSK6_ACTTE|nr:uncharacterized protein LOC116294684 [Actinia tenebrosa]
MNGARMLLLFCLVISTGGLPALTDARPGTNRNYGIMGPTGEEDSEKWAKEKDNAFKKAENDWLQRRFSRSESGSKAEESESGSNSYKPQTPFQMLKSRLSSSDIKQGHKKNMGHGVHSYSQINTTGIIDQAVAETIKENTTEPPPMPPTMAKTTSPIVPYLQGESDSQKKKKKKKKKKKSLRRTYEAEQLKKFGANARPFLLDP